MKSNSIAVFLGGATLVLGGCAGGSGDYAGPVGAAPPASPAVSDYPVKIGEPYKVGGKTYVPQEYASYDEVGYASWYGPEHAGRQTANGEIFNPDGISAAHKTLPLPSYVEVTALDTGRTILVRVNDRGPFAQDRLIDLSLGAARQLGIDAQGVTGVRVRKVNPNEAEREQLRRGQPVVERIATPDSLLKILRQKLAELPRPKLPARALARPAETESATGPEPTPAQREGRFIVENADGRQKSSPAPPPTPATPSAAPGYIVQIAAFGSKARADALAQKARASVERSADGSIWRVRYGPYDSMVEAERRLGAAKQSGYGGARILRTDP